MVPQLKLMLITLVLGFCVVSIHAQPDETREEFIKFIVEGAYNYGNVNFIEDSYTADFIQHPGDRSSLQVISSIIGLHAAMPDMVATVDLTISEADFVAVRFHIVGTFQNEMIFPNAIPIPPNGEPIILTINSVYRFNEQGQIAEEWTGFDNLGFLAQIGIVPTPQNRDAVDSALEVISYDMEPENKQFVQDYFTALSQGDLTFIDRSFRQDFTAHNPLGTLDKEGTYQDLSLLREAIPDLNITVEHLVSEGDWTAAVTVLRGTFIGDYILPDETVITATGGEIELPMVTFFRFDDQGLLAESRELYDSWDFLYQLGLLLPSATGNNP